MAANGQRLGGVGRVCQELEALLAALFGCWAAQVRSRTTLACGQSGLRGRPRDSMLSRFPDGTSSTCYSEGSWAVLAYLCRHIPTTRYVFVRAAGTCTLHLCGAMEMPGIRSSMVFYLVGIYLPTPALLCST